MVRISIGIAKRITLVALVCTFISITLGQMGQSPSSDLLELVEGFTCGSEICLSRNDELNRQISIRHALGSGSFYHSAFDLQYSTFNLYFWYAGQGEPYLRITSATGEGTMTVGDLINYMGEPCSVTITVNDDGIHLQYPHFYASISIPLTPWNYHLTTGEVPQPNPAIRLSPYWHIQKIQTLRASFPRDRAVLFSASNNITAQWYGFTTTGYYVAHRNPGVINDPRGCV